MSPQPSNKENYTPRKDKFVADSPMDSKDTEVIAVAEREKSEELTKEELVKAFGETITSDLTLAQIDSLNTNPALREYIRAGKSGEVFDRRSDLAEQLLSKLFDREAAGASSRRSASSKKPTTSKALKPEHTSSKREHDHSKPRMSSKAIATAVGLGILGAGFAGYLSADDDNEHQDSKPSHSYELATDQVPAAEAPVYFAEGKNISEMPGKHDINDFGPPSTAGFNQQVGPVSTDLEKDWKEMFQGNSHILASYLKVTGIGTDKMPSLADLSDPAKFKAFDDSLNKLGDDIQNDPKLHAELLNRLMKVLDGAHVISKGEYTSDQISFYSDERNRPRDVKEARVSLDRRVGDRGDGAKYLRVEATLEDGTKLQFDVKPDCHLQITWVLPSPEYKLGTPAPAPVETTPPPPESIPADWNPPVENPPAEQPPQSTPPSEQPPYSPPSDTPKNDHTPRPGGDNGTNAGTGAYTPAPAQTRPAAPPKPVIQYQPPAPVSPRSNLPPPAPRSTFNIPGFRSGSVIPGFKAPSLNSGVARNKGPVFKAPTIHIPNTKNRGGF